jgi:hypothetical protein
VTASRLGAGSIAWNSGALLVAVALGCGVQPRAGPVPLEGTRARMDSLSGKWDGTYRTSDGSRHGVIRFSLRPGADTAYGEVEITFSRALRLYGDPPEEELPRSPCRVINISLVRLEAGTIRGALAPYWDPDCECRAVTVFEGKLSAPDRVEGTFTSRQAPDAPVRLSGRWAAERR